MKCVKQKWKKIIIVIKFENVNTKGIEQGYGIRWYLKLMVNKLNLMRVLPLFLPFEYLAIKSFHGGFYMPTN
jgi:hypothetical protein